MATYYVNSGATGANTGGSWTDAFLTFAQGVTAATTSGDVIKVHVGHAEGLGAAATYTFAANVRALCVDKDSGDALAQMNGTTQYIGGAGAYAITLQGSTCYFYGLAFLTGGSTAANLKLSYSDGSHHEYEKCRFWINCTSTSAQIELGVNSNNNAYVRFADCDFKFNNTSQEFKPSAAFSEFDGGGLNASSAAPAALIATGGTISAMRFNGFDLSLITGTLLADQTLGSVTAEFVNCKLGSGFSALASQTVANKGSGRVWLFNCTSGDNHYTFAHYDALGSTEAVTTPYANDGALYDGTNHVSWKIVSTANASFYTPYISPWIDKYHSGVTAITPFVEMLRDGSASAFQDDEVWCEFSYQGTSGSTKSSFVNDRMTPLGTPANQAAGAGLANWTGEQATAWSGKLAPASSITPAEIGYLRARVFVGEPSITVYVDPTIRT